MNNYISFSLNNFSSFTTLTSWQGKVSNFHLHLCFAYNINILSIYFNFISITNIFIVIVLAKNDSNAVYCILRSVSHIFLNSSHYTMYTVQYAVCSTLILHSEHSLYVHLTLSLSLIHPSTTSPSTQLVHMLLKAWSQTHSTSSHWPHALKWGSGCTHSLLRPGRPSPVSA